MRLIVNDYMLYSFLKAGILSDGLIWLSEDRDELRTALHANPGAYFESL
jgi:hypothetical protein